LCCPFGYCAAILPGLSTIGRTVQLKLHLSHATPFVVADGAGGKQYRSGGKRTDRARNLDQVRLPVQVAPAVIGSRGVGGVHELTPGGALVLALPDRNALHSVLLERDEDSPVLRGIWLVLQANQGDIGLAIGDLLTYRDGGLVSRLRGYC